MLVLHLPADSFTWLAQAEAVKKSETAEKVAKIKERTAHYERQAALADSAPPE